MRPMRISVAVLMAVVLFAALGIAALRRPTQLWASFWFTMSLAVLCTSMLGAAFQRDRRAFWTGFSVFGWAYLLFAFWPHSDDVDLAYPRRPLLLSTLLLDFILYQLPYGPNPAYQLNPNTEMWTAASTTALRAGWDDQYHEPFLQITHSMLCLALGLVGATMARIFNGNASLIVPRTPRAVSSSIPLDNEDNAVS